MKDDGIVYTFKLGCKKIARGLSWLKDQKISIIIPIYNVEDYLSRCLESVMNQTLSDIEIIGVNDGTKDNSVEIMREYMALDSRMQLVEKKKRRFVIGKKCRISCGDGRYDSVFGFG